jgi:competence protein CoiA
MRLIQHPRHDPFMTPSHDPFTCCGSPVIAKCGEIRMHHWAHRGMCDPWWEGETEWHREWKRLFPKEWQEVVHFAENGEKHIADVKTDQGYIVEFQHSYIKSEEVKSREDFYKNMIWIVDGKRRLRDKVKFMDIWEQSHPTDNKVQARKVWEYFFDESALLRDWGNSHTSVFFDFGENVLYGLLPKSFLPNTIKERRYVFGITRNDLLSYLLPTSPLRFEALLKSLNDFLIAKEAVSSLRNSQPQQAKQLASKLGVMDDHPSKKRK